MDVRKISTIAWHEYLTNVRRISFILITLLFPAMGLISIIIAGYFSGEAASFLTSQFVPEAKPSGIVDQSGLFTPIEPKFAKTFVAYSDEATARAALVGDTIASYAVIPNDYLETGRVMWYAKSIFGNASAPDGNDLRAFLVNRLLTGKVDDATLKRTTTPAKIDMITLDSKGESQTGGILSLISGFVAPYIFSIMLFAAVFSSSGYLLRSVSEEKETRVIEIILSSVSPMELLSGKVIGLGALGLTQVGVWIGSAIVLSGGLGALFAGAVFILNPGSFLFATIYFFLGYLLYGALMATAGSLGTSLRESQQLAGLFTFWASLPWFLVSVVLANPNAGIARALSFFPLTAPTMMMLRLPMADVPIIDIIGSIISLVISIPVALWAGGKIFRIGLLMYGKRPTVKEIWAALRKA
ncbi:MAG: ABC transporter permease [Chloroflexi bacterium]|nr:ABC transporter permease [Chloroflexota bacterium]